MRKRKKQKKKLQTSREVLKRSIRNSDKYQEWRMTCFTRDKQACVICFKKFRKPKNFQIDHIKMFSLILTENKITSLEEALMCKELWNLENGRTLCKPCHKKTDTYGFKALRILKNLNK